MSKSVSLVRHTSDDYERNSVCICNETDCSTFHLTCKCIESVLKDLDVAFTCDELITCGDCALERAVRTYDADC